jgi:hypothetical protein
MFSFRPPALVALLLLVALLGSSCIESKRRARTRLAPWEAFGFRAVKAPRARTLNYRFRTPELADGQEVRFLFALQPERLEYYYVSVTPGRLALGKVERGVELPLAAWSGVAPAQTDSPARSDEAAGSGASAAPAKPFAQQHDVAVLRRPAKLAVTVGARKVIEVVDDTLDQGGAAIGARGVTPPRVRSVQAGGIYAADDFMRTREDASAWEPVGGHWAVESLKNPNLSANAFSYAGRPSGDQTAISLLGETWWDDYEFAVSVRAAGLDGFGLVFRYHDPEHYYVFRHAVVKGAGALELVRVAGGTETVLASRPAALAEHRWYRFTVRACGSRLRAGVDGNVAFARSDGGVALGRAGLYVAGSKGAEFDDVLVRGQIGTIEDFSDGELTWYAKGGDWTVERSDAGRRLRGVGPENNGLSTGKLLAGEASWADYSVRTTLAADSTGAAGIVFRYRDEADHDLFLLGGGRYRLICVRDGTRREVTSAAAPALDAPRALAVELRGGIIVCKADGRRVLAHFDDSRDGGKAGLVVAQGARAFFDDVAVTFESEAEPVLTQLDTFAREATMKEWAAAESDWQAARTAGLGESRSVHWHRGSFPGGAELRVVALFNASNAGSLHLFTACTTDRSSQRPTLRSGYEVVAATASRGDEGSIVLRRNGREVATAKTVDLGGTSRIAVRPVAGHVLVSVNDRVVLAYADAEPLDGWDAGYAASGAIVKPEDITVRCDRTRSYSFVRAPVDWRPAGGEWEITNRWRCDPRWSFFGGENMSGVCAMWNKTVVEGDITLEFAAGIRHQRGRGGYNRFVQDMNAVICGDGASLASGYGFLYGGWGNSRTAITRNGKVVAEVAQKIPTGGIHRRWFYHKITKRGSTIEYRIDNKLVLEFNDPDPLPGGQVALWTWQNGLMVARVRIAGQRVDALESFARPRPSLSQCLYNAARDSVQ